MPRRAPVAMPIPLQESDVTTQIRGFLEGRGWRPVRMQRTVVPGSFQSGEPGQADFAFLYYLGKPYAASLTLWVELKRPKSRMRCKCLENRGTRKRCTMCDQRNWAIRERARGGIVWSGVDDLTWFIDQYEQKFGWLHSGDRARGQLDLLAGVSS